MYTLSHPLILSPLAVPLHGAANEIEALILLLDSIEKAGGYPFDLTRKQTNKQTKNETID